MLHHKRLSKPSVPMLDRADTVVQHPVPCYAASEFKDESMLVAERLRAQDPVIIGELVHRYQDRLRNYLIRLTSDRDIAEDLLQETWIRLIAKGSQFKGNSQIGTWLFTIARNQAFDLHRKGTKTVSLDVSCEYEDNLPSKLLSMGKSPFDTCSDVEYASLLVTAVAALKPSHRRIIELRFYRDMTLFEIAQETGGSLSGVKTLVYRATKLLRRRLETIIPTRSASHPLSHFNKSRQTI